MMCQREPPRYGKRPADSAAEGDPQSLAAEGSTSISTSSSVKYSVDIVQQIDYSSDSVSNNQQAVSVKTAVKNENCEDFSRFNPPEFLCEDSNGDLINDDTFKDLISEIKELPPDFLGDIDFEGKDASSGLKPDDRETADRAIRAAIQDMESRDKLQPSSGGRPSYDQAAMTLKQLAEQHQQKNHGQYNNRNVPPNFRTSDIVGSENPSPLNESESPYVKKELNSPLPSDPNSNEKRTLNLSPVSKLSPGGQFKQIYTESPSVPGPSPQNYSQNQDNQNNFNKGYNTNMNSSTAQFPQSQSMHYSQKMSPFNGEGSLQQTPQMAMNQNGQYLQVTGQHMQINLAKSGQQDTLSQQVNNTQGHGGTNLNHMNSAIHSPMNVQSPMAQMMSPMMTGPGPSPQMPQHHIHHMQNQNNQSVQMPRPSPNSGPNMQNIHGQKMIPTPGPSPNMNHVQSQMIPSGSPMSSMNQSQGQNASGSNQSQMCQSAQNQPGLNQSVMPNQMIHHMHGPNGQQSNISMTGSQPTLGMNMMQCQSMQGQFASGQMPSGQFVPNSMQRMPNKGVMPLNGQNQVNMPAQGQTFPSRMTSQNFRPGIPNHFEAQQQMMAQRAAQQQQMRMQMMQQSQVQHSSIMNQQAQMTPSHINSQMPNQSLSSQAHMQAMSQMNQNQLSQMTGQMRTSPNSMPQNQQIASNQMAAQGTAMVQNSGTMQNSKMNVAGNTLNHMGAAIGGGAMGMTQMSRPPPPEYRARMLANQQQSMMANMRPAAMRPGMAMASQVASQRMMQPLATQQNFMGRPSRPPNVTIVPDQWRTGIRNPQMINFQQGMTGNAAQMRMSMPNQQEMYMQNVDSVQAQQRYMIQNPQGQMSLQQMQASQSMMMSQGSNYQQSMGNGHVVGFQRMQSNPSEFEFDSAQFGASDAQELLNSFDSSGGFNMM
ncbi:putative uncharacterized protein DDB_G0271606 isoform X2 [Artemia franciscana]|uniref:putative uncharacterized protein DDB_G0271606 isoform X2 n=1 Tax=Artemia franciscana TaxID=6661 RepID=UPI0032DB8EAC